MNRFIKSFPKNFVFGTATSSYQIEGSSFGGCGENHWDTFSKTKNATYKNQNGRIACRHVTHWEKDLDLIADAGFKAYRFSFSSQFSLAYAISEGVKLAVIHGLSVHSLYIIFALPAGTCHASSVKSPKEYCCHALVIVTERWRINCSLINS